VYRASQGSLDATPTKAVFSTIHPGFCYPLHFRTTVTYAQRLNYPASKSLGGRLLVGISPLRHELLKSPPDNTAPVSAVGRLVVSAYHGGGSCTAFCPSCHGTATHECLSLGETPRSQLACAACSRQRATWSSLCRYRKYLALHVTHTYLRPCALKIAILLQHVPRLAPGLLGWIFYSVNCSRSVWCARSHGFKRPAKTWSGDTRATGTRTRGLRSLYGVSCFTPSASSIVEPPRDRAVATR